jgi:hypothetical protein
LSLLDALLNEGYRDPRAIYIALRADGNQGSGGPDDPIHGGVVETSPLNATLSLVIGSDPREIIVTTSAPHGYIEGDIVVLSGTRDTTGALAPSYDGPYQIKVAGLSAKQFKCFLDYPATISFTGTAASVKRIFLIDQLFRSVTQLNVVFHLGPGVFETRGNAGYVNIGNQGWEVRPGWKIRGSGIDVTTMKLADARGAPNAQLYLAIGSQTWYMLADYSDASDMTIDCNAQGNRTTSVGAIILTGSHTRVRRIRAINWGPQAGPESFVINVGGYHPALPEVTDCIIEDCIADQPGLNNTHETTILSVTGTVSIAADGKPGFFRGGAIRRNVVDATYSRNEVQIQSIVIASGKAVVTTAAPHGRATGDWVVIAGAIVDGTELNGFNGSYSISNVSSTGFEYTPSPLPGDNPTGTMFVDRFPSHWVTVDPGTDADRGIQQVSGLVYKLRTVTPHNRIPGNNVVINGVSVEGFGTANAFNGPFLIVDVGPSPKELRFTLASTPEGPIDWPKSGPYIGVTFHVGAGAGTCQVVEHNRVIGVWGAVYTDTYSARSLHVRNNHFHRLSAVGVYRNLGNYFSPPGPILGLSLTRIGTTATFQTHALHFLEVGQIVRVEGAEVMGTIDNPFNGDNFKVTSVNPTSFTYEMTAVPATNAEGDIAYRGKDTEGVLQIENNVIELLPNAPVLPAYGIAMGGGVDFRPNYIFRQVAIRRNFIRHMDNTVDNYKEYSGAVGCYNCGALLIEDNVIALTRTAPIHFDYSGMVSCVNNRTPQGALIKANDLATGQAPDVPTAQLVESYFPAAEDAFVLAL